MAFGIDDAIAGVSKLVDDIVTTAFPTAEAKASAAAVQLRAQADAVVEQLKAQQAVMLAEAQSQDRWTSRARPSLLYVMYSLILAGVPFGFLAAFRPEIATHIAAGLNQWLAAIPDMLWQMMGFCYLGYTGGRTWEKVKGVSK